MTAYAVTPVQPAGLLEAIRDQASGFLPYYLPPTVVREAWDAPHRMWVSFAGIEWGASFEELSKLSDAFRTRTVSPVLPDQPCPECGGKGKWMDP